MKERVLILIFSLEEVKKLTQMKKFHINQIFRRQSQENTKYDPIRKNELFKIKIEMFK